MNLSFWDKWGDKMILVALIIFFVGVAWYGWSHKDVDEGSFASDLAKQLVSALLTLLVATRPRSTDQKNGGNGNGTSSTTVAVVTPAPAAPAP